MPIVLGDGNSVVGVLWLLLTIHAAHRLMGHGERLTGIFRTAVPLLETCVESVKRCQGAFSLRNDNYVYVDDKKAITM